MLSTSAEGDFSVSLPPVSLGAIVGGAAPLQKAGPVLPSSRPPVLPSPSRAVLGCSAGRINCDGCDVMAAIVVIVSPLLFIISWAVCSDN